MALSFPAEHYPAKELADASASGDLDTIKQIFSSYLADRLPGNYELQEFWPVLLTALAYDHPEITSYLLDVGVPLSRVHVQRAIETKSTAIFDVLLHHGWKINEPLSETQPPVLAFVVEDWEVTNWSLDHSADPNATCRLDLTPMSFAVQRAPVQTVRLLFDRGGDIERGQLIHHAVERDNDVIEVLQLLLEKGAALNARMYENHPASWNLQWFRGLGTALHRAADLGKVDVVRFLLQEGADLSIRDSKGRLAVDCARKHNHAAVVELLHV